MEIKIIILTSNDEEYAEIYEHTTGEDLLNILMENGNISVLNRDGIPNVYSIYSKHRGLIPNDKSLFESGVREGDTLAVQPYISGGAYPF